MIIIKIIVVDIKNNLIEEIIILKKVEIILEVINPQFT